MEHKLILSPNFTIRPLETPAEIDTCCRLNAQTFRSDEDIESLSQQVFTQLLFSFRPVTWAINQPGQHIPEELIPVLNILFPSGQAYIARSDSF